MTKTNLLKVSVHQRMSSLQLICKGKKNVKIWMQPFKYWYIICKKKKIIFEELKKTSMKYISCWHECRTKSTLWLEWIRAICKMLIPILQILLFSTMKPWTTKICFNPFRTKCICIAIKCIMKFIANPIWNHYLSILH